MPTLDAHRIKELYEAALSRAVGAEARVAELEAENAALKDALADAGFGPGFWFRGWERAREHFQRQVKGNHADD